MLQQAIINDTVGCDSLGTYVCYGKVLCRMLSTTQDVGKLKECGVQISKKSNISLMIE